MGVGKTTVSLQLKNRLNNSVFLDGDWCWDSHPFQVTDETKSMVLHNICFLLNQFIHCPAYENVIFCWVMHEQSIIDTILASIDKTNCTVKVISLICDEETLKNRLDKDIESGIRSVDILERSIARIPLYRSLRTKKVDVSNKTIDEIVSEIIDLKPASFVKNSFPIQKITIYIKQKY